MNSNIPPSQAPPPPPGTAPPSPTASGFGLGSAVNVGALSSLFPTLARLFQETSVMSVYVHRFDQVSVVAAGKLAATELKFPDLESFEQEIAHALSQLGLEPERVLEYSFPDSTRMTLITEPIGQTTSLALDLFARYPKAGLEHFIQWGALNQKAAEFLQAAVSRGVNVIVSSNDQLTRLSLFNALTRFTQRNERIVSIDHAREVYAVNRHVLELKTSHGWRDGRYEPVIDAAALIRLAHRRGCDRLFLDTLDESNASTFLSVLEEGLMGITSIQARSATDALQRILAFLRHEDRLWEQRLGQNLPLFLHIEKSVSGQQLRRITAVDELIGSESIGLRLEPIYEFQRDTLNPADGQLISTSYVPSFFETMRSRGPLLEWTQFETED